MPLVMLLCAPGVRATDTDATAAGRYRRTCAECHDKGKSKRSDARGAPRLGDARAWESRVGKGRDALYRRLLAEPHGRDLAEDRRSEWRGRLTDADVGDVLDYMLEQLP